MEIVAIVLKLCFLVIMFIGSSILFEKTYRTKFFKESIRNFGKRVRQKKMTDYDKDIEQIQSDIANLFNKSINHKNYSSILNIYALIRDNQDGAKMMLEKMAKEVYVYFSATFGTIRDLSKKDRDSFDKYDWALLDEILKKVDIICSEILKEYRELEAQKAQETADMEFKEYESVANSIDSDWDYYVEKKGLKKEEKPLQEEKRVGEVDNTLFCDEALRKPVLSDDKLNYGALIQWNRFCNNYIFSKDYMEMVDCVADEIIRLEKEDPRIVIQRLVYDASEKIAEKYGCETVQAISKVNEAIEKKQNDKYVENLEESLKEYRFLTKNMSLNTEREYTEQKRWITPVTDIIGAGVHCKKGSTAYEVTIREVHEMDFVLVKFSFGDDELCYCSMEDFLKSWKYV